MCDYNNLDAQQKAQFHQMLLEAADAFGGKNRFLQLLEAIRRVKPHPLSAKNQQFRFEYGSITWDKVIFQDKLNLLIKARTHESEQNNLLPSKEDKSYKKVLNLLRTLGPITFTLTPQMDTDSSDQKSVTFKAFEMIDAETSKLNPLFDALFFCSVATIKKLLNYEPKGK